MARLAGPDLVLADVPTVRQAGLRGKVDGIETAELAVMDEAASLDDWPNAGDATPKSGKNEFRMCEIIARQMKITI